MTQKIVYFTFLFLISAGVGCGSRFSPTLHQDSQEELKAKNDASLKYAVDTFMSENREFRVIDDPDTSQIKEVDFKTFSNDTYQLEVRFNDNTNFSRTGQLRRNYDSDKTFDSLYLDDFGKVTVFRQTSEPRAYCPRLSVNKNLKDGEPSFRVHVCESKVKSNP